VETARIPRGAVASWLENAGKKKTTFLDCMLGSLTAPLQCHIVGLPTHPLRQARRAFGTFLRRYESGVLRRIPVCLTR
jgi:hypothetical protein